MPLCRSGRENLCERARFTGLDLDGGYAERAVADERFCFPLPDGFGDLEAAPLLCAGLIGHRALRLAGDARAPRALRLRRRARTSSARSPSTRAGASSPSRAPATRPRRPSRASSAASGRATRWRPAPEPLDAAIIFAPVGALVPPRCAPSAAAASVVCAGIHMSDIPSFPYAMLWGERVLRSVANLTRADGVEFLDLAPRVPVRTHVTTFALEEAEAALDAVRGGAIEGAAVV